MISLPTFRAKKIDSDEYIEGQYLVYKGYPTIFNEYGLNGIEIDKSTLSIHFPDRKCENCKHYSTGKQPDGFGWHKCEYNFECKTCFNDYFEVKQMMIYT